MIYAITIALNCFRLLFFLFLYLLPLHILHYYLLKIFGYRRGEIISKKRTKIGKVLCGFLELSGPVFIKFGQILSTRSDLLGKEIAHELSRLQEHVHPFSYKKAKGMVETELDASLEEVFREFEQQPVSTASVAQVYKAVTKSGKRVAVKILRPGIRSMFRRDVATLFFINRIHGFFVRNKSRYYRIRNIVTKMEQDAIVELDLRMEAAAADHMRSVYQELKCNVAVPKVLWHHVTGRIMVMEWVDGVSLNAILEGGQVLDKLGTREAKHIAKTLMMVFFYSAFTTGAFHGDTHPGNVLISNKGEVVLVDFGIVGFLSFSERLHIAETICCFFIEDYERVVEIHWEHGYFTDAKHKTPFLLACRAIREMSLGENSKQIAVSRILDHLIQVLQKFQVQIKPQFFSCAQECGHIGGCC